MDTSKGRQEPYIQEGVGLSSRFVQRGDQCVVYISIVFHISARVDRMSKSQRQSTQYVAW